MPHQTHGTRVARIDEAFLSSAPAERQAALEGVDALVGSGLQPDSIALSGICTYQSCDRFFSARRLGIHSGRIFTAILIEEKQ